MNTYGRDWVLLDYLPCVTFYVVLHKDGQVATFMHTGTVLGGTYVFLLRSLIDEVKRVDLPTEIVMEKLYIDLLK